MKLKNNSIYEKYYNMKKDNKQRLFEVMYKIDDTYKSTLNEMYDGDSFGLPSNQPNNRPSIDTGDVQPSQPRTLSQIAREIRRDWGANVNYAARPYLDAMSSLSSPDDSYGYDSGKSIVLYFLSNASTWRGENAKRIKAELKKMVGLKEEFEPSVSPEAGIEGGSEQSTKYRAEVTGVGENVWSGNGMEYNTEDEAKKWLDGLSSRWFGYDMGRVVPVTTPRRQPVDLQNDIIYQNFRRK